MLLHKNTIILSELKVFFTLSEKAMETMLVLYVSDTKFGLSQASE